jgi:hypothetical protein
MQYIANSLIAVGWTGKTRTVLSGFYQNESWFPVDEGHLLHAEGALRFMAFFFLPRLRG